MHAERNRFLIEKASAAVQALTPNTAIFFPGGLVIARSSTGKLRAGTGWGSWWQGDGDQFLREHLEARLNGRDYFAVQFARDLAITLDYLKVMPVANVGRRNFHATSRIPVAA